MGLKITLSGQTIVKPTALGPVANTDTKLLIYGAISKGPSFGTGRDPPLRSGAWYPVSGRCFPCAYGKPESPARNVTLRPEAAHHGTSKTRNQRWIDLLRSTGGDPGFHRGKRHRTQNSRSTFENRDRFTERRRTARCCLRATFSKANSRRAWKVEMKARTNNEIM